MAQKLYTLLDVLMGGPIQGRRLRRQFHDDPESVTKELLGDARKALYGMRRGDIVVQVANELLLEGQNQYDQNFADWFDWFSNWPFPDEFPVSELPPECQAAGVQTLYPDPQPRLYRIVPSAAPASGATLSIDVVGQGFVKGKSTLSLIDRATAQPLPLSNQTFTGTFRCGHLKADVKLPTTAKTYDVRVTIDAGTNATNQPVTLNVPGQVQFTAQ